jgi:[citrate (pro-3S)-lyase] ligase
LLARNSGTAHLKHGDNRREEGVVPAELEFYTVDAGELSQEREQIERLLRESDLGWDSRVGTFVVCREGAQLIACAGLDRDVVKCVAISPAFRGSSLSLQLGSELLKVAMERGHFHLFLFTKPENAVFFRGWGFYPLVEVQDRVTLMENSPIAIRKYCKDLQALRQPGGKIGCIVMNANPLTLGHRYLAEIAAGACDWLHVFIVREEASMFSYAERYELASQGLSNIRNITVHHGSEYIISRATFPSYFLKGKCAVDECFTAVDLLLFREYIAPALDITHRYVGTEPICQVTNKYNQDMKLWLEAANSRSPSIEVVEVPRTTWRGGPISASEVRRLLQDKSLGKIEELVPESTMNLLISRFGDKQKSEMTHGVEH